MADTLTLDTLPPGKRQQILDGAGMVFAQDGYEGASMSRIAAEAGVSKGTLYNYFPGKAELFAGYVQQTCGGLIEVVFEAVESAGPPEAALRQIGGRLLRLLLSEPALLMHRMAVAEAEKFPELARIFYDAGPARAIAHLGAYLRQATEAGLLRVQDVELAAEQFLALIGNKVHMRRQLRLQPSPSEAELDRILAGAVAVFLHGYGPQAG